MRITIDKGFRPLINQVMAEIGATDPKLAVNHIIGSWAKTRNGGHLPETSPPAAPLDEDEFTALTDWQ